jgi:hypothetical protein
MGIYTQEFWRVPDFTEDSLADQKTDKLRRKNKIDRDEGWDETKALQEWVTITGPSPLDKDILEFMRGEVDMYGSNQAGKWQETLSELMDFQLVYGLPMEKVSCEPSTYKEMNRRANNGEEALLAALDACARTSGLPSVLKYLENDDFKLPVFQSALATYNFVQRLIILSKGLFFKKRMIILLLDIVFLDSRKHVIL